MQFQHAERHSSRLKDRGQAHEKSAAGNKAQVWVWIGRAKERRKNILTWRASVGKRPRWRARSSWHLWSVVCWIQAWHISREEASAYKGFEPVLGGKQACRTSRDRAEEARVEEGWQWKGMTEARAMAVKMQGGRETWGTPRCPVAEHVGLWWWWRLSGSVTWVKVTKGSATTANCGTAETSEVLISKDDFSLWQEPSFLPLAHCSYEKGRRWILPLTVSNHRFGLASPLSLCMPWVILTP